MSKAPIEETVLRETKEEIVGLIAEQQRKFGQVANVRAAEDFVKPILEKVIRDRENEKPRAAKPSPTERARGPALREGDEITRRELTAEDLAPLKLAPILEAFRARVRLLRNHPEWKAKIDAVIFAPFPAAVPVEDRRKWRAKKYWEIYRESCRVFGDPFKPKEKRIQVG